MAKIRTDIILYKATSILEEKNLIFDNMSTFLDSKTIKYVGNVLLEKEAFDSMDVFVKLLIDPVTLAETNVGYDYMSINFIETVPSPNVKYYYFIKSVKWLSTGVLGIAGRLDVLNTVYPFLTFSAQTITKRRHFSRFKDYGSGTALRVVHKYDEGFYPVQYMWRGSTVSEANQAANSVQWNMIYRNTNLPDPDQFYQVNPVEIHLTTDSDRAVEIEPGAAGTITPASLDSTLGYDYIFGGTYAFGSGSKLVVNGVTVTMTSSVFAIRKLADGTLRLVRLELDPNGYTQYIIAQTYGTGNEITIVDGTTTSASMYCGAIPCPNPIPTNNFTLSLTKTTANLYGIHGSYDRTDSKLIKVVKVPYSPVAVSYSGGKFQIPSGWSFDASAHDLKCDDANQKFARTITISKTNYLNAIMVASISPAVGQTRNIVNESKLYHSAFYTYKFAYDSFSVTFPMENVNAATKAAFSTAVASGLVTFDYVVSSTISGRFLFSWADSWGAVFDATEDYPFLMNVARNNEEPVFTSAYINYLRTGYNYDVKAKNLSAIQSATGIATSAAAGLAAGALSGNLAGAIVGAAFGALSGALSAVSRQVSAEQSIQQKLTQAKAQSVSVAGSDDVDLMVKYAKNRLSMLEYRPSDETRQMLFNLFYYYGYACNETGAPTHHNRYYFDFLQCDAEFDDGSGNRLFSRSFIDEVKRKFSEGVTYLHQPMCYAGIIETTFENWEDDLIS